MASQQACKKAILNQEVESVATEMACPSANELRKRKLSAIIAQLREDQSLTNMFNLGKDIEIILPEDIRQESNEV